MGLTVSNTTVTALGQRFVTKADTASGTSLGSATVSSDSGSANTYGSWAQIIASTAAESYITELGITLPASNTPIASDGPMTLQLGTGAAASEVVKYERLIPFAAYTAGTVYLIKLDAPFRVTASKRVAARLKGARTATVDVVVAVYGLPITQTEGN
jgi:hypothetical protein